ncbi:hypothetical protein KGO95_03815 [Patescibacteria group bacterium]|nr:hypothetical protein [Patescibacteria group bacterium]
MEKRIQDLQMALAQREGVMRISVDRDPIGGLSGHDSVIDRTVFNVVLVPTQQNVDDHKSFTEFFWREAKKLDLHHDSVSLEIREDDRLPFDPPN